MRIHEDLFNLIRELRQHVIINHGKIESLNKEKQLGYSVWVWKLHHSSQYQEAIYLCPSYFK